MRISLLALIILLPFNGMAAAWNQPAGKGQIINNFSYYQTNRFHTPDGESVPTGEFRKMEYNPYAEYGLNKDITIGTSLFFDHLQREVADGTETGSALHSADFFARTEIYHEGSTVVSVQPLLKIPGTYSGDDQDLFGDRQVEGELRLLAGHGFQYMEQDHFVNVEAAFRTRSVSADEYRMDGTLGIRPDKDWLVLAQAFTTITGEKGGGSSFQFNNSNNYNLLKLQLSGVYDYNEEVSLQLGGFYNAWAENTGGGGGLLFSIWYRF